MVFWFDSNGYFRGHVGSQTTDQITVLSSSELFWFHLNSFLYASQEKNVQQSHSQAKIPELVWDKGK